MQLRMPSVCAALVSAVALAGAAHARTCSYATGQCTAAPCPGTTLDMWGQCVISDASAGCPAACTPYTTPDGQAALCGLETASAGDLTVEDAMKIRTCMMAPDATCFIAIAGFLEETGCTGCASELPAIGAANAQCTPITDAATCNMTEIEPECEAAAMPAAAMPAAAMPAGAPVPPPVGGTGNMPPAETGTAMPPPDTPVEASPSAAASLVGGAFAALSVVGAFVAL